MGATKKSDEVIIKENHFYRIEHFLIDVKLEKNYMIGNFSIVFSSSTESNYFYVICLMTLMIEFG